MRLFKLSFPTVPVGSQLSDYRARPDRPVAFIMHLPSWATPLRRIRAWWLRQGLYRRGYDLYVIRGKQSKRR